MVPMLAQSVIHCAQDCLDRNPATRRDRVDLSPFVIVEVVVRRPAIARKSPRRLLPCLRLPGLDLAEYRFACRCVFASLRPAARGRKRQPDRQEGG
jgi:hypothetical protein